MDALLEAAGPGVETPVLAFEIRQLGGALSREPEVPNAVGHRDARFSIFAGAAGAPGMEEQLREPLFAPIRALAPWATGGRQINFLSGYETEPADVATAYEPAVWDRLRRIKAVYDPHNLFRVNYNIPPQA